MRGKGKGGGARGRDHISTRVIAVAEVSPLIFSARGQGANVLKEDYSGQPHFTFNFLFIATIRKRTAETPGPRLTHSSG